MSDPAGASHGVHTQLSAHAGSAASGAEPPEPQAAASMIATSNPRCIFPSYRSWVDEGEKIALSACAPLEIFSNAGGVAYSSGVESGWPRALVSAGGLLAPPILGATIIAFVHGPKRARIALALLAGALVLSVIIYVRSAAGVIAMPIVAAALGWSAWRGFAENPERRVVLAQILGVLLALDTLTRMVSYAFTKSITRDGMPKRSDIQNISEQLGGSYILWGMLITGIALGLLALASWWAWRRPVKAPRAPGPPTSVRPRPRR